MSRRKPGKYADVIGNLQPIPVSDPSAQEQVEKIKAELRTGETHTPESLAKLYAVARRRKDELKDELSANEKTVTALEQLLAESLDRDEPGWGMYGAGPNMIRLSDGSSVAVEYEPTAKVEDREAFRLWCIANGLERELQLWPTTTNALTKERLLDGQVEPDGVKAYVRPKFVYRK